MPITDVTIVRRCADCSEEIGTMTVKKDNMRLMTNDLTWCESCGTETREVRDIAEREETVTGRAGQLSRQSSGRGRHRRRIPPPSRRRHRHLVRNSRPGSSVCLRQTPSSNCKSWLPPSRPTPSDGDFDLATGALLVASTDDPNVDIEGCRANLDRMAEAALARTPSEAGPLEELNAITDLLFGVIGFAGNRDDYYDPNNSYLHQVLERRLGIPITLSLLCMEVGRRAGVPVLGIGMPGHFLVRHRDEENYFVDAFHGGVLMNRDECGAVLRQAAGEDARLEERHLSPGDPAGNSRPCPPQPEGDLLGPGGVRPVHNHHRRVDGGPSPTGRRSSGDRGVVHPQGRQSSTICRRLCRVYRSSTQCR